MQRADFGSIPLAARRLIRHQQRVHDLQKIDQQLLGLLKTREAILHIDPTGRDLSVALRDAGRALERELRRRGEDFGEAARTRRRDRGLPVGLAGKILPFRRRPEDAEVEADRALERELDAAIAANERASATVGVDGDATGSDGWAAPDAGTGRGADGGGAPGRVRMGAWLRWRSAETRMRRAFASLEAAELAGRPRRELERLVVRFERAATAHAAAEAILRRLDATDGCGGGAVGPQDGGRIASPG